MTKMTWAQKDDRNTARRWGLSAFRNIEMVRWCMGHAAMWDELSSKLLLETDEDTQNARAHAIGRVAYYVRLAEDETNRAAVNARRAAHWAIESEKAAR